MIREPAHHLPLQGGTHHGGGQPYGQPGMLGDFIRYLLTLIRRNLLWIAAITGLVMAAAAVMTLMQTPLFTAAATVQINDQSEKVLGEEFDAATGGNSDWDIDRFLNTQLDILRSRGLALRVAQKLKLMDDKVFYAAMGYEPPAPEAGPVIARESAISLLQGSMVVDLPQSTRIASISFSSTDPAVSARVANGFAEEFIQSNLQRRFDSSAYARNFVQQQLGEARLRLESSERELNAYAREAGLIRSRDTGASQPGSGETGSVTSASLMQINEAANQAQARRVEAEGRWNAERATPLLSSQVVLGNPTVQSLMTRRSTLAGDLQDAKQRYLPDHPAVSRLQSELSAVDRQLAIVAQQVRDSIRADYGAAKGAEDALRAQVDMLKEASLAEQDRLVRYNTLAREADTNRSIYDGLLQRYRELNAASGISASNIAIIDRADPPQGPSSPNMDRNLALAMVLGLALSAVFVFLRDQLDDRIRIPEEVEAKIHLHLLGVIPLDEQGEPLVALADPKSPLSEAYNSLRGSLFHATPAGLPRILLITSAQPSEGKSTTSYAIARSMALAGKRTLLIDADLRRPSLHRIVSAENERGLSSLLTSTDAIPSAASPSSEDNLTLITSGPIPPSPTELLSSPRMAALLEEAAASFDVVIIDSAPVLGLADSPILSAIADGVVMVIEADRGRGGSLKTAIRRLRAMNPVILGAVLTKFDAAHAGNRYSEYYGYEYYRYSRGETQAG